MSTTRKHRSDVRRCIRWLVRMGRVHITGYDVPTLAMPGPDIAFEEACFRIYEWSKFTSYGRVSHRANNATWIKCSRCAETNGMDPDARNLTHNPLTGAPTGHDGACDVCWGGGGWVPGRCPGRKGSAQ